MRRCVKADRASPTRCTSRINVGLLLFALRKKLGRLEMSRCANPSAARARRVAGRRHRVGRLAVVGKFLGHATWL